MHSDIQRLFDLTGKVAVITGGAVNLGFDAAGVLAAAGCEVVITSRDTERATSSAAELTARYGHAALGVQLDHTQPEEVARVLEQAINWQGLVDIAVNNAGGSAGKAPGDFFVRPPDDIRRLVENNLLGPLYCSREIGRHMAGRGAGKIINIASMAGLMGRDRRMYERSGLREQPVEYAAAKAGVIAMTMDLAGLLSPRGVCVNAISPGGFERGQPAEFIRLYSDRTPLGRMGRDGFDLHGAVLFLASPASDYVTGQNLVVDGGFSIWH